MTFVRQLAAAGIFACLSCSTPALSLCLETGEYEQAIADMEAREAARAKEAEATAQAQPPSPDAGGTQQPAEVAATTGTASKPN